MLLSNNCHPLITIPTRVTNTSHTIIDNIITNDPKLLLPGVIQTDVSDHYPVFSLTLNYSIPKANPDTIFRRDKSTFNTEDFRIELESNLQLFSPSFATANKNNFNQLFSEFIKIIENTIEIHAPLKKLSRKQRKLQAKPWITKELLIKIQQKRKLYRSHYLDGDETEKQIYKNFANKLNKAKTKAKQIYFREQFLNNKDNPRKTWQLIKSAIPFNKSKTVNKKIDRLIYNDQELVENQQIAEKFNEHFTSIGIKLADKIHSPNNSYRKFMPKRELPSIFLEPPRYNEIYNAIHSLGLHKSSGYDNIDAYFIRTASHIINPYLTHLCFLSFEFGIFSECLKVAKVIPIFKTGSRTEVNNYRPISILSNFSKIFEKLIVARLTNFLKKQNILLDNQYGFRPKLSTTHAMLDVINGISSNMNKTQYTGLIFLDLKKAFDTVSHSILLQKLEHYGIRGNMLDLFTSYLSEHKQYVSINGSCSSMKIVKTGVPQGSNLGPVLFSVYVNDIFNHFKSTPVLYADDTCLNVKAHKLDLLETLMNQEMEIARQWMLANKLTINTSKTKAMVISPKIKKSTFDYSIKCGESLISVQQNIKYLGLIIDDKLNFKEHIKIVERKVACAVGILAKSKHYLPQDILMQLYHALIDCHLTYAIPVWGSTFHSYFDKLIAYQNKAVKIIAKAKWNDSPSPLYNKLGILKLDKIYQLEVAKIMHRIDPKKHPPSLARYFQKSGLSHSYSTRTVSSSQLHIPFLKLPNYKNLFSIKALKFGILYPPT